MILPHLPSRGRVVPCAADTARGNAGRAGCSVLTTPGCRQRVGGVSVTGAPGPRRARWRPLANAAPWESIHSRETPNF
jgi:hypothetical protein